MKLFWLYSIRSCLLNQCQINRLLQVMFLAVLQNTSCVWGPSIETFFSCCDEGGSGTTPVFYIYIFFFLTCESLIRRHRQLFSHLWIYSNLIVLCTEKNVDGLNCKFKKTVFENGGLCHKEWASMENGQFVTEHHSCLISGLDIPRRVHLKEGIWLH